MLSDWALGVCCFTPVLLGLVGLASLRAYVDYYVLLPLMIIFLLLGVYGWIQGGRIIRRNWFCCPQHLSTFGGRPQKEKSD